MNWRLPPYRAFPVVASHGTEHAVAAAFEPDAEEIAPFSASVLSA